MENVNIKGKWTPKKRVLTAFSHEEPDRMPIDYTANIEIHNRFAKAMGVDPNNRDALLEKIGGDFRHINLRYTGRMLNTRYNGKPFPLKNAEAEEIRAYETPDHNDFDYETMHEYLKSRSSYAAYVGGTSIACIINIYAQLRGFEEFFCDLAFEDEDVLSLVDRGLSVELKCLERILERDREYVTFMFIGEDLGTQRGPLISMDMYRRLIKPRHKAFTELAKSYDLPIMIHSCGASSGFFDDFLDLGISGVDTIQPEAAGMDPHRIKSLFGDRLTFRGGISTSERLVNASPEEAFEYAAEVMDIMKPNGGYFFCPSHQLQDNTPVENVVAIYKAAQQFGKY